MMLKFTVLSFSLAGNCGALLLRPESSKPIFCSRNLNDLAEPESFSLSSVRRSLIRQEETIIFALIERAQYRQNKQIYEPGLTVPQPEKNQDQCLSFLNFMLSETEKVHAKARRYTSEEEHPFFEDAVETVKPVIPRLACPPLLVPQSININREILRLYTNKVVPAICSDGDDDQHGSSALCDIACLQALSRRIHIGKFVAEQKFVAESKKFTDLVTANDIPGINNLLTNDLVEERVCQRARIKAVAFGQDAFSDTEVGFKIAPNLIVDLYRDMIIPLTKQVQVRYLFERVGVPSELIREEEWPDTLLGYMSPKKAQQEGTLTRPATWM